MASEGSPELESPEVAGVVGPALSEALDAGLDDDPRGVEVGLPHPEADDVVHRRRDVEEAPDPRWRHDADALSEDAVAERRAGVEVGRHRRDRVRHRVTEAAASVLDGLDAFDRGPHAE